jgi:hypothetical protein
VVVDNDLSELSRNIVHTLDASGAVKVAARADTLIASLRLLFKFRLTDGFYRETNNSTRCD